MFGRKKTALGTDSSLFVCEQRRGIIKKNTWEKNESIVRKHQSKLDLICICWEVRPTYKTYVRIFKRKSKNEVNPLRTTNINM